jgi:hypothetical protein
MRWTLLSEGCDMGDREFVPQPFSEAQLRDVERLLLQRADNADKREALALANMAELLDPVVFWCRFCRSVVEASHV